MKRKLTTIKTIPFQGGCNTAVEPALLENKASMVQNFRQKHPGMIKRAGQIKQHSTAAGYTNNYPVAHSATYVKATTTYDTYYPYQATDPSKAVTGTAIGTGWLTTVISSQRFHIDLGTATVITRFYYENYHHSGLVTNYGVKDFTLWGSNESSAFAELTYATDTNWTQLTTSQSHFEQHMNWDVADPQTIVVTNAVAYRYYALKFVNNYGAMSAMGIRKIVLQSTSGNSTNKMMSLYQFSKGKKIERNFYVQMSDSVVLEATTAPPGITNGEFGASVFTGSASPSSASWATIDDILMFCNSVDRPKVFVGTRDVAKFIVYVSAAAIPAMPILGVDFTDEVIGISSNPAILDSLGTLAQYDCLFIMTEIPCDTFTFIVSKPNGDAAVMQWKYMVNGTWTAVSGFVDNTIAVAGKTMGQSGTMVCTLPTNHTLSFMYGKSGYWHQLSLSSGALDAEVELTNIDYASDWVTMPVLYDGNEVLAIEVQLENYAGIYTRSAVGIDVISNTTTIYFSSFDPVLAIKLTFNAIESQELMTLDVAPASVWPNGTKISGQTSGQTATINHHDDATPLLYWVINRSGNFTLGEVIGIAGNTADQGASNPTFASVYRTMILYYWNGTAWVDSTETDGTIVGSGTFQQDGWISWATPTDERKQVFRNTQYQAYWYKMGFNLELGGQCVIGSLVTIPIYSINDFGNGCVVANWNNRAVIVFSESSSYVVISALGLPFCINGDDAGIYGMGDGRNNKIVNVKVLGDKLLCWQAEKGSQGGCISYLSGNNIENIEKKHISNILGTMNAKSVDIVDGIEFSELNRDTPIMSLAFFLSRSGVYVTDGSYCYMISQDITNYFDPISTACIRVGYEEEMWLKYDSANGVIRIGLVSGSSATVPNIFPVYDVKDKTWSFDVLAQELSCMTEVEAASGNIPVVQMGGGVDDGFVYILNSGMNDVATAIDSFVTQEFDGKGEILNMSELLLRAKIQSAGNITVTPSLNSIAQTAMTFAQTAEVANQTIRRHRTNTNLTGQHITLKVQHNTVSESCQLLDMGTGLSAYEEQ